MWNQSSSGDELSKWRWLQSMTTSSQKFEKVRQVWLVPRYHHGKVVATKYIAIASTKFLKDLRKPRTVGNLPSGYNNLFLHKERVLRMMRWWQNSPTLHQGSTWWKEYECVFCIKVVEWNLWDDEVQEVEDLANLKIKEGAIKSDGSYEVWFTTYGFIKVKSASPKSKKVLKCIHLELVG